MVSFSMHSTINSFDYAQQVHYPSDPLQPGPIYCLTPRKCTVFDVSCEAIPQQVNFLTDEAGDCGKGVVSQLHHHHGLSSMQTTAVDKIKTIVSSTIYYGVHSLTDTATSLSPFYQLDKCTDLGFSNTSTGEHRWAACRPLQKLHSWSLERMAVPSFSL